MSELCAGALAARGSGAVDGIGMAELRVSSPAAAGREGPGGDVMVT